MDALFEMISAIYQEAGKHWIKIYVSVFSNFQSVFCLGRNWVTSLKRCCTKYNIGKPKNYILISIESCRIKTVFLAKNLDLALKKKFWLSFRSDIKYFLFPNCYFLRINASPIMGWYFKDKKFRHLSNLKWRNAMYKDMPLLSIKVIIVCDALILLKFRQETRKFHEKQCYVWWAVT